MRKREEVCKTVRHIWSHKYLQTPLIYASRQATCATCGNVRQPRECKYSLWHVVTPCSAASTSTRIHVCSCFPFSRAFVVIVVFEVTATTTHAKTTRSTRADAQNFYQATHSHCNVENCSVAAHFVAATTSWRYVQWRFCTLQQLCCHLRGVTSPFFLCVFVL